MDKTFELHCVEGEGHETRRLRKPFDSSTRRVSYPESYITKCTTYDKQVMSPIGGRLSKTLRQGSHRGEYFPEIRIRGSLIRFATTITTRLLWDVTRRFTCVVIFVEKSYFPGILDAMRSCLHFLEKGGCFFPTTSEQRGHNLKGFKDFYLKAKARIWP